MATPIPMTNPTTGAVSVAYQGFSWTVLLFGPLPALFRGHILGFFIMFIASIFTMGLAGLVFMFIYNGMHRNWLVGKGFGPHFVGAEIFGASGRNTTSNSTDILHS